MSASKSNKARMAKRVIEVLEFFDEEHPQATVMDIVRRFDRPQSSTSELLSNLVSLGLLHKDRRSRTYSLTARAALVGSSAQPGIVRDGRLVRLVDRLSAQTGLGIAIFGMVGLKVQVCSWRHPKTARTPGKAGLGGAQDHLVGSAAGQLLLSTVRQPLRDGMIRRMNAEAAPEQRFDFATMTARVQEYNELGYATGDAGFGYGAHTTAMLLPGLPEEQPLAVGFVYEPSSQLDALTLTSSLADAIAWSVAEQPQQASGSVQSLFHAA